MKLIALLGLAVISSSAFAGLAPVPEIDGALTLQVVALVGGLALVMKKAKK